MKVLEKIKALPFVQDIHDNGGKIYSVGGAVRDHFLGKESKDLDIVVQHIPPTQLMEILTKHGNAVEQLVGGKFGMVKFTAFGTTEEIDVALPRTERKIGAGHQGFDINANPHLPIEEDLDRRDITINSIAVDLEGRIYDPFDGLVDLQMKVIRVTNPRAFSDDPLRMLRVVQFAARFGFTVDEATMKLIKENAHRISEISGERILDEFQKIIDKGDCFVGSELLWQTGLYKEIFGVESQYIEALWYKKITRMSEFLYLLTRWITKYDVEKFYMKRLKGQVDVCKELKVFRKLARDESGVVERCFIILNAHKISPVAVQSFITKEYHGRKGILRYMEDYQLPFYKPLQVNGDDLIEMGVPEGPRHGVILKDVMSKVFNLEVKNERSPLLEYLKTII